MSTIDAILLAGGLARRFRKDESGLPKQFYPLDQNPVFLHSLRSLASLGCFRSFIVVIPESHQQLARELVDKHVASPLRERLSFVVGGERRQDSSSHALEALERFSPHPTRVLIHDACRPFLSRKFLARIRACLEDRSYGAWIPIVPVVDTIKRVENQKVIETLDRSYVQSVQTPQIFEYEVIRGLIEKVKARPSLSFTDDASLCEYYGIPVGTYEGDPRNVKITYDFELEAIKRILVTEMPIDATLDSCESDPAMTFTD